LWYIRLIRSRLVRHPMNTLANSRMAFASLEAKPIKLLNIPLTAGMSIGVLLVCVELIMMLVILSSCPARGRRILHRIRDWRVAWCLRAAYLRRIFTKIADIGSDLMKISLPSKRTNRETRGHRNCTETMRVTVSDPTADGFETYGVTGVAYQLHRPRRLPPVPAELLV